MKYSEDANKFFLDKQNENKRKKLKEKFGAEFYKKDNELSPELENLFLNNVMRFEEEWENAEEIVMHEYLNKPKIKNLKDIKKSDLPFEIERILKLFRENNINVSVIEKEDVSNEDFYRFLSQELMQYKFYPMPLSGMRTNFIYEEFHPSKKLDSKDAIEHVLYSASEKSKHIRTFISEDKSLSINGKVVTIEKFIENMYSLFEDVEEEINRKIEFKKFEFSDVTKVGVNLIIKYKQKETLAEIEKLFNFIFELTPSQYGGMEIINYSYKLANNF